MYIKKKPEKKLFRVQVMPSRYTVAVVLGVWLVGGWVFSKLVCGCEWG